MIINFIQSNYEFLLALARENDTTIEMEVNRIVKMYKKSKNK